MALAFVSEVVSGFLSFPPRIQVAIALVLLLAVVSVVAVAYLVYRSGAIGAKIRAGIDRLLGRPEQYSYTVFSALITLSIVLLGVFGWAFSESAAQTKMGSGRIAEIVLGFGTNFMLWAALTVLGVVIAFRRLRPSLAEKTARKTRFTASEVEHIAAEAKTTDGTNRVIGDASLGEGQLRAKLLRALDDDGLDEGIDALDELAPDSKFESGTGPEYGGEIGQEISGALPSPDDVDVDIDDVEGRLAAEIDILEGALNAECLASHLDYSPVRGRRNTPAEDSEPIDVSTSSASTTDAGDSAGRDVVGTIRRRVELARMDAAASTSKDELASRFVAPAVLSMLAGFTVFGTVWVHPLLMAANFSFGLFVGSVVYLGYKRRRRKNVEKARSTPDYGGWRACDALAKKCTTERGTDFYVVWMAGHSYFGFDRHRIARKVADRWHQRLNGQVVAPAIHETFHDNACSMLPLAYNLEYTDDRRSRGAIYDAIADVVRQADDAIVPKMHLCELVVDRGPDHGYDPDLVGDVYQEMVGEALEEFEVELRDTEGELVPMTLVTLRTAGVPLDMEALRSEMSNQISPEDEPLYSLPDVEDSFDIEDALAVGVPPGVDPTEWNGTRTATPTEIDAPSAD